MLKYYPPSIFNVIKHISRLPGIGEKTAERLTMHILKAPKVESEKLAHSIMELKNKIRLCSNCFALSDDELCGICNDTSRDNSILCIVEHPADMVSIEKSGSFNGFYHILGGVLSPMNNIGPDDIRYKELIERLKHGTIQEVIIATSTSVEGEATASFISGNLKNVSVKVSRIASGVPMGGDLKYVDQATLKRAMETRHEF